jgi:hypothetical protein
VDGRDPQNFLKDWLARFWIYLQLPLNKTAQVAKTSSQGNASIWLTCRDPGSPPSLPNCQLHGVLLDSASLLLPCQLVGQSIAHLPARETRLLQGNATRPMERFAHLSRRVTCSEAPCATWETPPSIMICDSQSIGARVFPSLSAKTRVFVAFIILAILLHILLKILRGLIYFVTATFNILVIGPVFTLISVTRVLLKILKLIVLMPFWAVCSLALGVAAILTLFGICICWNRQTRAEADSNGGDDEGILKTAGREASLTSVRDNGMGVCGFQGWRIRVSVSDRLPRDGHNVGIIAVDIETDGVWQTRTLG